MNSLLFYLLCLLIVILVVCCVYLYNKQLPEVYVHESGRPGPSLLVVGGTHGNEPAGAVAAFQLHNILSKRSLKRGRVVIVPNANKWGLRVGIRYLPAELMSFGVLGKIDLNRSYSHRGEESRTRISQHIEKLVLESDWVIDLHEGYDFHQLNPQSMGSGIYPGKTTLSKQMSRPLLDAVNQLIRVPEYQFISKEWPDEKGTLRMFCDEQDIHYTLVETSGQNNIQPIPVRVRQHLAILRELIVQLQI
jgi:predicted deacylase